MTSQTPFEPMELTARDGYRLAALRYPAAGRERARLIVAAATAVPQSFYRRFAEFAAGCGFTVLTFDYRGIGRSAPARLRGFDMRYLDWAELDLAAAVDAMSAEDGTPLFIVGHSFGGHAFGLLPNHQRVSGFYVFATGAGWHGWMPWRERVKVQLMWNVVSPPFAALHGYLPARALGMGENLPLGVYRDWRRWCGFPRYFFDDPRMRGIEQRYAAVRTPIVAANALDDLWALPRSRDAFVAAYRNAPLTRLDIDPGRFPDGIGHMGYFRGKCEPLWRDALDWFDSLTPRSPA